MGPTRFCPEACWSFEKVGFMFQGYHCHRDSGWHFTASQVTGPGAVSLPIPLLLQ